MPTASEIVSKISSDLHARSQAGTPAHDRDVIELLNRHSSWNWSFIADETTNQSKGIGEIFRMISSLGDDPEITIHTTVTIHGDDRDILRAGSATGQRRQRQDIRNQAIANAIRSLAP